jgi:hypothetical protein
MPSSSAESAVRRLLARSRVNRSPTAASARAAASSLDWVRRLGSDPAEAESLRNGGRVSARSDLAYMVRGLLMEAGIPVHVARTALALAATALAAWAVVGLVPAAPPVAVHPASGLVTFGQTIPQGAQVFLHPKAGELPEAAVPRGTVAADGSVTFATYPQAPGVPAGDYVAIVHWYPVGRNGEPQGNALPAKYRSPATSPLSVSIQAGVNRLPAFRLVP